MAISQTNRLVIQLRRDYASHWEKYKDVVPAIGEPCYIIDKNILKIGDGITKFCDLKPINGVDLSDDIKTLQCDVDAVQSNMKILQDDIAVTLSQVESAVQAIEVVEF